MLIPKNRTLRQLYQNAKKKHDNLEWIVSAGYLFFADGPLFGADFKWIL